jgi:hypothetical protein
MSEDQIYGVEFFEVDLDWETKTYCLKNKVLLPYEIFTLGKFSALRSFNFEILHMEMPEGKVFYIYHRVTYITGKNLSLYNEIGRF